MIGNPITLKVFEKTENKNKLFKTCERCVVVFLFFLWEAVCNLIFVLIFVVFLCVFGVGWVYGFLGGVCSVCVFYFFFIFVILEFIIIQ